MLVLLAVAIICSALPASAGWVFEKQKDLGRDTNNTQWYIGDYGTKDGGIPFATVRSYYTGTKHKENTIVHLMSNYGIAPEIANELNFTEYEYEYTKDGKQFAVIYRRHYYIGIKDGQAGAHLMYGTDYNDATKVFLNVNDSYSARKSKDSAIPPAKAPAKAPAKKS